MSKPIKIFIPIIAYNRQAHVAFMMSVMRLVLLLKDKQFSAVVYPITFESLISRARNAAAAHMLSDPDTTHLLFIDSDIEFNADDVLKMLEKDADVIAASYPQKFLNMDKTKLVFGNDPLPNDPIQLCTILPEQRYAPGTPNDYVMTDGMIEVKYATTGFMLIKRSVFEQLIINNPSQKYENDIDGYMSANKDMFYNFFPSEINQQTKKYESEDFGFCRLWRDAGGSIKILVDVNITHIGWFEYKANLQRQRDFFGQLYERMHQ